MNLGGTLSADDPIFLLTGQSHIQRGTLIAVAVDVHDGEDADLLVGAVEQRVEGIGVVLPRLRGGQDRHARPVAHIVIVFPGVVGHRFGQVIELPLLYSQTKLVNKSKQTI